MKLKFLAVARLVSYEIQGSVINGIDTSLFTQGAKFVGNDQTRAAGVIDMFWVEQELHIVLAQPTWTSDLPWAARDAGWVDASTYDPEARYVEATNPQAIEQIESGRAEYWRDPYTGKWTVRLIQLETQIMEPAQ